MPIALTEEQVRTIGSKVGPAHHASDPRSGRTYVLIAAEVYEQLCPAAGLLPAAPLPPPGSKLTRNCRELIRFRCKEDEKKALKLLLDLRQRHSWRYYREGEWWTQTETVRTLRAYGAEFDWITEDA